VSDPTAPAVPPLTTVQWVSRLSQPAIAAIVAGGIVLVGGAGLVVASILGGGERPAPVAAPEGDPPGTLVPTPLGTPSPEPTIDPDPGEASPLAIVEEVDVGDGAVTVPIPENWSYKEIDGSTLTMSDDVGDFIYLKVASRSAGSDPVAVVSSAYDSIVAEAEGYSQLQAGDPETLELTGALTGSARIQYSGLWNDTQTTYQVGGVLWAQVRQDGTALFLLVESSPAGALNANAYSWTLVTDGAFSSFAGG